MNPNFIDVTIEAVPPQEEVYRLADGRLSALPTFFACFTDRQDFDRRCREPIDSVIAEVLAPEKFAEALSAIKWHERITQNMQPCK